MRDDEAIISGHLPAELLNKVSFAVGEALDKGMELDTALSLVVTVAADYGRAEYTDDLLDGLCRIIQSRRDLPLPDIVFEELEPNKEAN